MLLRASAWLAIAFALALGVGEILRNWGDWQWWPFWLVDYIAVFSLAAGAALALRRKDRALLCAAWGFTAAMFWMSLFGHLDAIRQGREDLSLGVFAHDQLVLTIGALLAAAGLGLTLALAAKAHPQGRGAADAGGASLPPA